MARFIPVTICIECSQRFTDWDPKNITLLEQNTDEKSGSTNKIILLHDTQHRRHHTHIVNIINPRS